MEVVALGHLSGMMNKLPQEVLRMVLEQLHESYHRRPVVTILKSANSDVETSMRAPRSINCGESSPSLCHIT